MDKEHDIHHIHLDEGIEESPREYAKLAGVLGGILLVSLFLGWARGFELTRFMGDFMAVFFVTFALFKLFNIEEFAAAYRGYDLIARRIPAWAYIFPFVEGILGFAYLLLNDSLILNVVTIIITAIGAAGVWRELKSKSNIMCACLGTLIKLPLSKVSLVEDLAMFAMAALMIVL